MKHSKFTHFFLIFIAVWLFFSCNFKKIPLDAACVGFEKTLQMPGNQVAQDIIMMPDSGFAITGHEVVNNVVRAFVTRTDKDGGLKWHKFYQALGAIDSTFSRALVLNSDNTISIAGQVQIGGKVKIFVAKITDDANLIPLINDTLPDPQNKNYPQKAFFLDKIIGSDDFLLCGQTYDNPYGGEGIILRLNSNMSIFDYKLMDNAGTYQIKSTGGNGFIAAGYRFLPDALPANSSSIFTPIFHVSRWSNLQTPQWGFAQTTSTQSPMVAKQAFSAVLLADGTVVAGGYSRNLMDKSQIYLEHFDVNGNLIDSFEPDLPEGVLAFDIIEAEEGDGVILACGTSSGNGQQLTEYGFLLAKVSLATKKMVWKKAIDNAGVQDDAVAVARIPGCGYIVVGRTAQGKTGGATSTLLVRTDLTGK
jgi:hypothetical protein